MQKYFANIGNTHTQLSDLNLANVKMIKTEDFISKHEYQGEFFSCCVLNQNKREQLLAKESSIFHFINQKHVEDIFLKEANPTLGEDRIANMIAGANLYTESFVIIDCGTCITLEFVDENRIFQGGFIIAGRNMQLHALHNYTSNLPNLSLCDNSLSLNTDTFSAIMQGVNHSLVGAIKYFCSQFPSYKPYLTGGDKRFFYEELNYAFADKNLTLKGVKKYYEKKAKK